MRALQWLLLAGVMFACVPLPTDTNYQTNSLDLRRTNNHLSSNQKTRTLRASTTNRKRQTRPSFLFLLGRFFGQTISDTSQAFGNITQIFNDQFTTTTPSPDMTTEEDFNSTTEKPPPPITRQQLFGILGSNYRGLVRLFDTEWQAAVEQSSKNVVNFRKELREAIRPYFLPNRNLTRSKT